MSVPVYVCQTVCVCVRLHVHTCVQCRVCVCVCVQYASMSQNSNSLYKVYISYMHGIYITPSQPENTVLLNITVIGMNREEFNDTVSFRVTEYVRQLLASKGYTVLVSLFAAVEKEGFLE